MINKIVPAVRTENITYAVRDIVVLANQVAKTGKEMLYLNIGDPNIYDFAPPKYLVDATYQAMLKNLNGYAPSSGIKEAVAAIEKEADRKGITNVHDIFVTTGASEAIDICLTALVNDGENVLTPTPGYPLYTAIASKLQMMENPYYLNESNGWLPDIDDIKLKINDKTRAIILINPNNPTGSIYTEENLRQIIDLALKHNLVIFADEIYDKLLFDGKKQISIGALNKDVSCITFGGLSKNYMVPGFRIGWGIVSGRKEVLADYIEAINKILRARLSANHPEQYGIKPCLEGDQDHLVEAMKKLSKRRDLTVEMLNAIPGISCVKPEGAFYAFPKLEMKQPDNHFVAELIKETGVVVVPGSGFGQVPGTKHFRVVFLPNEQILEKAYKAIGSFFVKYQEKYPDLVEA
ncbi:MAG: aminotransferase class I/II-fold pyridoxal phosphate-dependent enzyme [Ignavibacteriota bacterium]|jgi:alanine-synthesizing transaminase|nr:aminotransferase class I/II-fold pyridoxal phosphate-dependent enzyme [Ignavibacteriota bacterium]MBW7842272.1 aminotransferase class I/II-fold pyridoxal phosphate-dependent enzyme [Ignavibacterium sp.]MCO6448069.1 aminotransferase class I/II-fold pyridoxal phosphate-dependent enzyme [Ignavibacterium album]MCZ2268823.1 aminotransferase class I/II-fold pyridoxal phosphate-dependent enzyme [Ignavibacteriales bacterium]MDX9712347.1 aminotransferase class I/II-fold pyridoxal phosphate-dependent 